MDQIPQSEKKSLRIMELADENEWMLELIRDALPFVQTASLAAKVFLRSEPEAAGTVSAGADEWINRASKVINVTELIDEEE